MKISTLFQNKAFRFAVPLIFWAAVWQAAAALVGAELLLPAPTAVVLRFFELAVTPDFWQAALTSLYHIFLGAVFGVLIGSILSVLTSKFGLADIILSPAIRIVRTVPVASFIILVLLWVRKSDVSSVISCLMVTPVMWESVSAGISSADKALLEAAHAYKIKPTGVIRYVYLPAVKPHFMSGVCTSVGLAWKSGIAAEVLCLPKNSVGTELYYSKIYLETPSLFAWTITVILMSLALERVIVFFFRGNDKGRSKSEN
ncbi:MAG: ABC transporter permease subunit [Firmicutes bacterium]|nr:ABC transporter permease subunit [Bacillota bacterium]